MVSSRIDKYRDLRSGLKDEVGISRDNISNIVDDYDNDDADDFLASVNRFFNKSNDDNDKNEIEDTLTEVKFYTKIRKVKLLFFLKNSSYYYKVDNCII